MILYGGSNSDGTSFGKVPNTIDLNAAQNHECVHWVLQVGADAHYTSPLSSLEGIKRIWCVLWGKDFITHWSRNSEPHS